MKTAILAALAASLALSACQKAPDAEQPAAREAAAAAAADPVLARVAKDFPAERFEFVGPPGSAISLLLDRTSGCMYNGQKGTPILDGNGNPDCGYKPQ